MANVNIVNIHDDVSILKTVFWAYKVSNRLYVCAFGMCVLRARSQSQCPTGENNSKKGHYSTLHTRREITLGKRPFHSNVDLDFYAQYAAQP